ncbi:YfzA family protein [Natribacillus halophilus]|uniref:YfzA-like protein n=1 Tax=Natribacillus halophilus TaxID=549003 RepID=A0A1G8SKN6_9BACI|nr:YfzA family protein [Natribacillus halophilus]SDJ29808.1 YfzA-like protein [Natribacillus halophilus]
MTETQNKSRPNRIRSWIIKLGGFFTILLIFFALDGTFLEPNLNDSNNIAGRAATWLEGSSMFNQWFSPFSFSFFNLATMVIASGLLVRAVEEIFSIKRIKERQG